MFNAKCQASERRQPSAQPVRGDSQEKPSLLCLEWEKGGSWGGLEPKINIKIQKLLRTVSWSKYSRNKVIWAKLALRVHSGNNRGGS